MSILFAPNRRKFFVIFMTDFFCHFHIQKMQILLQNRGCKLSIFYGLWWIYPGEVFYFTCSNHKYNWEFFITLDKMVAVNYLFFWCEGFIFIFPTLHVLTTIGIFSYSTTPSFINVTF